MDLGDNFPNLPVPMNSRRVCLGYKCLETGRVLKKVLWLHKAEDVSLEEIAERVVLSLKLLNGLTLKQLREAHSGNNVKIYYDMGE